ncbi:MFS transporter [Streptomyces sp. NPDC049597]|uniref:MFS transporter n=1 Tax=Streptomyces sp. NPDC049597 TaxID=3155276 RepID=UPI00343F2002
MSIRQPTERPVRRPASVNRVTGAALVGTVIEFYDFALYATAAAIVFGPVFFPGFAPATATLAAFGTFATGFVARPLGSVLFGHIGDRLGRRVVLQSTVLVTGLATFAVGLLPGYRELGVAAPVCLVVLRFVQGLGIGGEWTGAVLIAGEHAPADRRGLWASYPQTGPAIGFLLANGCVLALSAALPEGQFLAWGWRVPFWCAGLLTLTGFLLRSRIVETPVFQGLARDDALARSPLRTVLRRHRARVLLVAGAVMCTYAVHYTATTWAMSHLVGRPGFTATGTLLCLMAAMTVMAAATPVAAALGDRYGRRTLSVVGCLAMGVTTVPYLALLGTGGLPTLWACTTVMLLALITMLGVQGAYIPELFAPGLRTSGTAVSYNLGAVLGGALTPLINSRLSQTTGDGVPWAVAAYLVGVCAVSLLCLLRLPDTHAGEPA